MLLGLISFALPAFPENNYTQVFDDYQVHYSVFNTSFLSPEVASSYHIVRSGSKALINIAVLQKQANGTLKNVTAKVTGEQFDLIRKDTLPFREVREENAIYYLSDIDIQNRTTIYFTVLIQPDASKRAYKLEFNKMLYKDEQ
jgi:hypothetical protein